MWFGKRRDPRVGDEIRFHRDRLIDDYMAAGMDRAAAERRAFLEFGNIAQIEEACRDARGRRLDDLGQDLRYALRALRRSPAFAAVAVLSLALGIGANAAIFSLVNAVMLRSLPVREPDRLVQIRRVTPEGRPGAVSYPLFEHFRDNVRSISGAFAQAASSQPIAIDGEEDFVMAELVSGEYYDVLGIAPAAGRLLGPADDVLSPAFPAAVISDRYWQRRFGRSPSAIGKSVRMRERIFTIVGVTPASFESVRRGFVPDITLPLLVMMTDQQRQAADSNWLTLIARLKPGATIEQVNAEVRVLFSGFAQTQAAAAREKERDGILRQRAAALSARDGFNPLRENIAQPLLMLMGIVGLTLLLTCVNVSGLLLARAAARRREISIRLAIGASRGRLMRQFLTESLVLASLGGAAGLAMATWFSERLFRLFVNGRDLELSVTPDWRVVVFTGTVSVVACVLAGLAPALQAVRVTLNPALKEVRAQGRGRLGGILVTAQLAISMVLVVAATLFVGTLIKLYAVDRGFDSNGLLVVNIRSTRSYPASGAVPVQRAVLERLRALPGIRTASAAQVLPVGGGLWDRAVRVEGYTFRSDESDTVGFNVIAPDYFATLGTPRLAGRDFTDRDTDAAPRVAIVNQSFARYFFRDVSAIGRRVTSVNVTYEIVGVVGDAKYQDLRGGILKTMYIPWTQREGDPPTRYTYLVRIASGDPLRLVPGLERLVEEADSGLRVRAATSYSTLIDRSVATERIMATLGGLFGLLAIVIAAVGMFGLLAFHVARRTNEIGVRMALGASRGRMMGLVLRDVAAMAVPGIAIGGAAALLVSGLARKILFGLTPTDPRAFAVAAAILAAAAFGAGWLPARRASRVDPLVALRHE